MTDAEKVAALTAILEKHDAAINDDDGGERPFNEAGEVIEALWSLVSDDRDRLVKAGWIPAS
jgi:hypothetical protein